MDSNPIHHPSPAKKMKCSFLDFVQLLMISRAGWWTQTPSATPLPAKKWNAHFWIMFNFWWLAGLVDGLKPHPPPVSSQKNEILIFVLRSTSDDQPGWLMDSNPICHPSPAKKMKCSFLDYVQLLMISQAGQWTQTPSTTPLHPKKWNAHFWITFNFWWSAGLVDGLEPHPPPLSSQKNEMLIFVLCSTSDDWPDWSMDSNPIHHPSPANKMKCFFLDYVHFWWSARLVDGLKPHPPPVSSQKNEMLIFVLHSTSDVGQTGHWTQTPSTTPLQPKKWNTSFLDYAQLLMIGRTEWWTRTPSTIPLQPKKWNAHFWITFNFWWLARLVNGLKPHPPPLSSQKNEMLVFDFVQLLMISQADSMDLNPICHPSPAKKMKCSFLDYVQLLMISQAGWWTRTPSTTPLQPKKWNAHILIMFNFWWLARLVNGLEPHPPPLSSQKNEMLIFGFCSTSDDLPGWLMDSNPICHPSPAKKWNAHFWIMFNFWWLAGLVDGLKPHPPRVSSPKNEMLVFVLRSHFWWSARLVDGLKPHPPPLSSQKNEMLIFGLHSTSDDQPGLSMDLNPIHHLPPANKMKCSYFDYVQLLMISRAGWWTQTPSATPLQPKKWNAHFCNTFNFWCSTVIGLEPHPPPLCSQKKWNASFLDYAQLLMIGRAEWWTQTPSTIPLQPKKWNAHFWIPFNFWWLARLVDGLKPHPPLLSSQKNEMLIFGLCSLLMISLADWWNPICHPSPTKKMKCSFLYYFNFWWLAGIVNGLEPHPPPSPAKKMKCSYFDYVQLLMIGQAGQWTRTPSTTCLQPKTLKCSFLDFVQLLMICQAGWWTQTPSTPLTSQKNEMLIFGLCSTSDD